MSAVEQQAIAWPLDDIADVLGGALREVKPGVYQIDVPSKPLGTSLALQLAPFHGAVRLEPERDKRAGPWTIGSIIYVGIGQVEVYPGEGEVAFRITQQPPHELIVTHLGQFRLIAGIDPAKVKPIIAAATDTPVTIVGRLARPVFTEAKKTPFWQAGLAEQRNGADQPVWHNLKAWGQLARTAHQFTRGQRVRVTGTRRLEKWEKDGQTHIGTSILLTAIEPV